VFTAVAIIYNVAQVRASICIVQSWLDNIGLTDRLLLVCVDQASFGGVAPLIATAIRPTVGGLGVGVWMSAMSGVALVALRCSGGLARRHHQVSWVELGTATWTDRLDEDEDSSEEDEEGEEATIVVSH